MSMESAVAFYERVESDVGLQEKLTELGTKENVSQYVRDELGYDFTLEEMQKVIFERHPEMTDEELEAVVGGTTASEIGKAAATGTAIGLGLCALASLLAAAAA